MTGDTAKTYGEQLVIVGHAPNDDVGWVKAGHAALIDSLMRFCPAGRWRSMAVTHIEMSSMLAVKSMLNEPPA